MIWTLDLSDRRLVGRCRYTTCNNHWPRLIEHGNNSGLWVKTRPDLIPTLLSNKHRKSCRKKLILPRNFEQIGMLLMLLLLPTLSPLSLLRLLLLLLLLLLPLLLVLCKKISLNFWQVTCERESRSIFCSETDKKWTFLSCLGDLRKTSGGLLSLHLVTGFCYQLWSNLWQFSGTSLENQSLTWPAHTNFWIIKFSQKYTVRAVGTQGPCF